MTLAQFSFKLLISFLIIFKSYVCFPEEQFCEAPHAAISEVVNAKKLVSDPKSIKISLI